MRAYLAYVVIRLILAFNEPIQIIAEACGYPEASAGSMDTNEVALRIMNGDM